MIFNTPIITLLLALAPTTLLAAPTQTLPNIADLVERRGLSASQIKSLTDGKCDLSGVQQPPAPTKLPDPSPGLKLSHIAIGRGTQNYTCKTSSATETPTLVGAVAKLFNATCSTVRAPAVVADVTRLALTYSVPETAIADQMLSGFHEFTAAGTPYFGLRTATHNFGDLLGKKNASSPAPADSAAGNNGLGSVPWLKMTAVGGTFKEVYRLNTAGGQAPATCEGITAPFSVDYAAEYWFYV
jgi:hypothetical protein